MRQSIAGPHVAFCVCLCALLLLPAMDLGQASPQSGVVTAGSGTQSRVKRIGPAEMDAVYAAGWVGPSMFYRESAGRIILWDEGPAVPCALSFRKPAGRQYRLSAIEETEAMKGGGPKKLALPY